MKPVDVKSNIYIDCGKETNYEYPKFNIGDNVGISKNKNVFAEGYTLNWSEDGFMIQEVKKYCAADICY